MGGGFTARQPPLSVAQGYTRSCAHGQALFLALPSASFFMPLLPHTTRPLDPIGVPLRPRNCAGASDRATRPGSGAVVSPLHNPRTTVGKWTLTPFCSDSYPMTQDPHCIKALPPAPLCCCLTSCGGGGRGGGSLVHPLAPVGPIRHHRAVLRQFAVFFRFAGFTRPPAGHRQAHGTTFPSPWPRPH